MKSERNAARTNGRALSVLIVEDHELLRAGLRALLEAEPGFTVVGEARTGEESVMLADELRPDLIVMDIRMPGIGGIEATRLIRMVSEDSRILALTMDSAEEMLLDFADAGGDAYLGKAAVETELVPALRRLGRGESLLDPAQLERLRRITALPLRR